MGSATNLARLIRGVAQVSWESRQRSLTSMRRFRCGQTRIPILTRVGYGSSAATTVDEISRGKGTCTLVVRSVLAGP